MNTTSDMANATGPVAGVLAIKLVLNPGNEETAPPVGSMRLRFLVELLLNLGEADAMELAALEHF